MNQCLPSSQELVKQFACLPLPNEDPETLTQWENSTNVLIYVFFELRELKISRTDLRSQLKDELLLNLEMHRHVDRSENTFILT